MTAVQQDDGSEIIALARKIGIAGFAKSADEARSIGTPPDATPASPGDPDGADLVALAQAIGLAGFRHTVERVARPSLQSITASSDPGGEDVVALARAVGLSGFSRAPSEPDLSTEGGKAADHAAPVQAPDTGQRAAAVAVLTKTHAAARTTSATRAPATSPAIPFTAPADGSGSKRESLVTLSIVGSSGRRLLESWEQEHGNFGCGDAGAQVWLERSLSTGVMRAYALPADAASIEALAPCRGVVPIDPGSRLLVVGIREVDRSDCQLRGPGSKGLTDAQRSGARPSTIAPGTIQGLAELTAA
jgi:hypothetical protein